MLLGLLILFQSCYTVERNCLPFHTGTFEFTQIIKNEMKTSTFTRDSLYEIEQFEGKIDTASIRWVNDCECILTKLNPTSNQEKRPIQIKIISTTQNSYVFEYSLVGDAKNTQRGTIQKIN
ncbi:MAG: hypothetical protein O3C13_01145 [Bacteroidetes bacterium]|nr:hypothetical protein [Bacteroidota bacterium]